MSEKKSIAAVDWFAAATTYLLVVLYANLYGFWRPFKVNVFTFEGFLDVLTNALFFVMDGAMVYAAVAMIGVVVGGSMCRLLNYDIHTRVAKFDKNHPSFWISVSAFAVIAIFFWMLPITYLYATTGFLFFSLLALGLIVAAHFTRDSSVGTSRSLKFASIVAVIAFPAFTFGGALSSALAIKDGCGRTRITTESAAALSVDVSKGRPVYLGHMAEYFILYADVTGDTIVVRLKEGQQVRLGKAGEVPSHCPSP